MNLLDIVTKGSTDRSVVLRIINDTTGIPETGVVFNTSGIALWYRREGAAKTDITEATLAALTTAHTDGGFLHIADGEYRLDLPDAAFATAANYVDVGGAVTGMIVIGGRVRLVDYSLEDAVRMGMTALPNAAAAASGGLFIRGTGAGAINQDANGRIDVNVHAAAGTAWASGAITAASIASDAITDAKVASDVTIASVTGAVGSVTGNVGGNVTGSVGSVATGGITSASFAADSVTASALAADAVTEIQSGLATSAQLNNIAVAGAPVFKTASSSTLTTGSTTSGTFASTVQSDNSRHILADTAGTLEIYYEFNIGGDGVANSVQFEGFLTGSNDSVGVYARNWAGSSWDQIGTITGKTATTDDTSQWNLTTAHTGTGANLGLVRIRFQNTGLSSASLNVDRLLIGHAIINRTVGYQDAAVWIDTVNGTAGTESYVNGTVDRPVSALADAVTIAAAIGLRRFHLNNGSSITLGSGFSQRDFIGENWTLALGGQALTDCLIQGASISGTCTGTGLILSDCDVDATLPPCLMHECGIEALTVGSAGEYDLVHCHADADPAVLDFGAAVGATDFHLRGSSGDWEVLNLLTGDSFEIDGDGEVTLDASVTGGTVKIAGNVALINNGSGITLLDTARYAEDQSTASVSGAVGSVTGAVGSVASGGITAASFAANAITAAKIDPDVTTELQAGLATASALSTVDGKIDTIDNFLDTEMAAVKGVTDKLDTALELDSAVYRFTTNALEQAPTGGSAPTASQIADAVWEEAIADHSGTSGSTAEALNAAGSAGDPWVTALPGAYSAGQAGHIVGTNVNATISSRATPAQVATELGTYDAPTKAELDAAVAPLSTAANLATVAGYIDTEVAAIVSTLGSPAGASVSADIAAVKAQTAAIEVDTQDLQAQVGTDGAGLTAIGDTRLANLDATVSSRATPAQVNTEADTALADVGLTTTITGRIDAAVSSRLATAGYTAPPSASDIWTNGTRTLTNGAGIKKNTALSAFMFLMVDDTDGKTPETGLTITAQRSLDGAAFASCANSATEVSLGWYKIDLAAGDVNGDVVVLRFTGTGARTREIMMVTEP